MRRKAVLPDAKGAEEGYLPVSQYPSRPIALKTPKASRSHTKAEDEHLSALVELGCALSRYKGIADVPAEVHHIRSGAGAGRRSSHFDAIPLAPHFHRLGPEALHTLGRKAWERLHGITELELLEMTKALLK